jgi:NADPH:quinone reductase-like Zn-dependent oxidoreductase
MKAIRIYEYGGNEVLHLEDIPVPEVEAGEIRVRVRATSINPVDWKTRLGYLSRAVALPLTLGWDVAGDVDAIGDGITGIQPGDAVYGMIMVRGGAYAEYAVLKVHEVAAKPATLSYEAAAAVPLVALTAFQALDLAKVSAGQTVLVHGGAGGIGSFAVQMARSQGARVLATASARNHDLVRELGALEVIDYEAERFEDKVRDLDVVIDTIGGEVSQRSLAVLKPSGVLVSTVSDIRLEDERVRAVNVVPNSAQLTQIAALIDSGVIKPLMNAVLPLAQAAEGLRLNETRHGRGKIVLSVD